MKTSLFTLITLFIIRIDVTVGPPLPPPEEEEKRYVVVGGIPNTDPLKYIIKASKIKEEGQWCMRDSKCETGYCHKENWKVWSWKCAYWEPSTPAAYKPSTPAASTNRIKLQVGEPCQLTQCNKTTMVTYITNVWNCKYDSCPSEICKNGKCV